MSTQIKINHELHYEITQFYYYEASLLNNRKYLEWIELLTDDIVYKMPVRINHYNHDGEDFSDKGNFLNESIVDMRTRARRLLTKYAWSDDPPSRTRRYITNVVIRPGEKDNELDVTSSFLFTRSRGTETKYDLITGEREDTLRYVDGQWKIASRIIYPDQTVIGTLNLNMFL